MSAVFRNGVFFALKRDKCKKKKKKAWQSVLSKKEAGEENKWWVLSLMWILISASRLENNKVKVWI